MLAYTDIAHHVKKDMEAALPMLRARLWGMDV
jgi:hypothetical protein